MSGSRYHYMDYLRAFLIIGGVFYHAGLIYSIDSNWRVVSDNSHQLFNLLTELVSSFRMPSFFLVSGFFCAYSFSSSVNTLSHSQILKKRLLCFVVPFVIMSITIQPIQYLFKLKFEVDIYELKLWESYLEKEEYISHLWFLVNLVAYYLIVYLTFKYLNLVKPLLENICLKYNFLVLCFLLALLFTAFYSICYFINKILPDLPVVNFLAIAKYVFFFLMGYYLFICNYSVSKNVFSLKNGCIGIVVSMLFLACNNYIQNNVFDIFSFYIVGILTSVFLLASFSRLFQRENILVNKVTNASYSIYIFHQIIIIALSYFIVDSFSSSPLEYISLVFLSIAITIVVHYLIIERFPAVAFLYNGKSRNIKR